jgi:hypothetical protein
MLIKNQHQILIPIMATAKNNENRYINLHKHLVQIKIQAYDVVIMSRNSLQ